MISDQDIERALLIIKEAIEALPNLQGEEEAKVLPPGEKNVHIGVDN